MGKKSKKTHKPLFTQKRTRVALFVGASVFAVAILVITVISVMTPKNDPKSKMGVGADGFTAFVEEDGDLHIGSIITKDEVISALGSKAKSVGDPKIDKVFNLNGDRAQTISFPFVRANGTDATLYLDVKLYKNPQAMTDDHIYTATLSAGKINGYPAFYKLAQTIGEDREYHLMVVNGQKAYRFVIAQPAKDITISEVSSLATLKKLAQNARF